jgi:hypothetical protein
MRTIGSTAFGELVDYAVVSYIKRKESEDYFDRDTNFTPFKTSA